MQYVDDVIFVSQVNTVFTSDVILSQPVTTLRHDVIFVFVLAGERGVRKVPGRVLSGVLYAIQVLRHAHQLQGRPALVDIQVLHVQTRRAQILRDLHHHNDLRQ